VWVVNEPGGTVHRQPVTLGEPVVGGISVTSGLTPGALVAVAGVHTLREGQTVRLLEDGGRKP
jgi:membrane fusion protein, multidrug efflux system